MMIRFRPYNIFNGCNGGMEYALCGMSQNNMNLGVLKEMMIAGRI